jgi:proline dehydrogenase
MVEPRSDSAGASARRPESGLRWLGPIRRRRALAYRAGTLDQAVEVCRRLAGEGIASVIGYSASMGEPSRAVADSYLAAFDRLSAEDLDCYVSVKLSGMGFDPDLFAELVAAAERSGRRLHVDALWPGTADPTMALLEAEPRAGPLGATLPGRWRRSLEDGPRLIELGCALRVVKGHWSDDAGGNAEPSSGFLDVVDRLAGYQGGVAVATHDVQLLAESLRRLVLSGTPCEAELLFGMPFGGPATVARNLGVPIRVYVPYGDTWAPYSLSDLRTHPRAMWWLIQDLLLGKDKEWRSIGRSRNHP